jgi:hypothetical protein
MNKSLQDCGSPFPAVAMLSQWYMIKVKEPFSNVCRHAGHTGYFGVIVVILVPRELHVWRHSAHVRMISAGHHRFAYLM